MAGTFGRCGGGTEKASWSAQSDATGQAGSTPDLHDHENFNMKFHAI
jgi:hypothetical protein